MSDATLNSSPKNTTYKKPKNEIVKRILAVFGIFFVLLILPATVNVALSSQDTRNRAQVITDTAATDTIVPTIYNSSTTVTVTNTTQQNSTQDDNFFWKIYPFALGVVILIWGGLIIVYFGTKFSRRI